MNHIFKRMVVVANDIENIDTLLEKAVACSKQHQTTLEVLFVHEEPLFKLPDYFLSDEKISKSKIDKNKIKKSIQEKLTTLNYNKTVSILVLVDDTLDQVLEYGKENRDILFITAYHKELNSKLLQKSPYSFWIVKNKIKSYKQILLPIDLNQKSVEIINATKHIFPTIQLAVVHDYRFTLDMDLMEDKHLKITPIVSSMDIEISQERKEKQRVLFEKYKTDFNLKGDFLEENKGLEEDLVEYINKNHADLIVMYPEEIELFLSSSLIIKLLHRIPKDFLVLNI
ncbi:hypothetical protein MNB_SV-13-1268 [hydrothermal vent metagenome]|uniref:UspA domain-containing protein n=1 Tax=hydrothermal vent metagenome TaxID=652676 RepID=A0A1W1CXT0_9ZZZZ